MTDTDKVTAIAFIRCDRKGSSKSPSADRQRGAIRKFAKRSGYEIIAEFADDLPTGPGFAAMLKRFEANGVDTIVVSTAASFALDPTEQAVSFAKFRQFGILLVAADAPGSFVADPATGALVDRVLKLAAQLDDAMRKAHLRGSGERIRIKPKHPHRRTYAEMHPEAVIFVKRLHQASIRTGSRLSLREISAKLADAGHLKNGKPFHPEVVKRMIRGSRPRHAKAAAD